MTEAKIAPRIDDDGVPWCDDVQPCPQRPTFGWGCDNSSVYGYHCLVDGGLVLDESVCPHHAAAQAALITRLTAELADAKKDSARLTDLASGLLELVTHPDVPLLPRHRVELRKLRAAIDALTEESNA